MHEEQSYWQQVQAEYACDHDMTEVRRRRDSLDRPHAARQCIRCGAWRGAVSKATLPAGVFETLPTFDEGHAARWEADMRAEVQRREDEGRDGRRAEYAAYLLTPAWRAKRQLVLARDSHLCQCCLTVTATEVHHLTYAHRGAERCYELQSVCGSCHQRITTEDQAVLGLHL